jgi:aminotransferase
MKSIVTGDGGMVYLKSNKLLNQLKEECYLGLPAKSTSGIDKSSDNSDIWWEVQINRPGRRSIMNNISAAMGIIQMNKLDAFQARRKFIYESYNIGFKENKFIQTPPNLIKDCTNSYYFYWIQLEKRNELAKYLKERDIYTTYRYWALNDVDYFNIKDKSLPNTDFASSKTLNLPLHPSLSDADIIKVINSVNEFFS